MSLDDSGPDIQAPETPASLTAETVLALRAHLASLRDDLSIFTRAQSVEPQDASTWAQELREFSEPEPVHTIHGQIWTLVEVTADQLTALTKTLTVPLEAVAPFTCTRALLESAALACWLLDPEADVTERVRRSLALRHEGITQQRKWAVAAGLDPDRAAKRLVQIAQQAERLGLAATHDGRKQSPPRVPPMPTVTHLVRSILDEEAAYRILSAIAHGHAWALHRLAFKVDNEHGLESPEGVRLRTMHKTPNYVGLSYVAVLAAVSFARVVWYQAKYFGWDLKRLRLALDQRFDAMNATAGVRFWRAE